eukprot:TRINITY_DN1317_c1_g1_i1.p1 TRINITY_DN1317_c1_g1~~TRINITY_DN1317_c1_g1_i1.p1  ORF type:complete len:369 (+),score=72.74 TRINITY_DN1317_c1_g1_i1:950-2056(+)
MLASRPRNALQDISNAQPLLDVAGKKAATASKRPAHSLADDSHKPFKKRKSDKMEVELQLLDSRPALLPSLHPQPQHHQLHRDAMVLDEPIAVAPVAPPHEDIDLYDWDEPQACTEYVAEIYDYMRSIELNYMVSPDYMKNQVDVNEKMRAILCDWLVEVHRMFKLLPETLFLSINLIDRYLEQKSVARDKLQLLGVTAMLTASKFEEIYAPECNDFVYISDGAYTKDQILAMEADLLNTLQFNLNAPSPLHYLRRFSKAASSDYHTHQLCKYLIELSIIDMKLLKYPASSLAAASVYIGRKMTNKHVVWTPTLAYYTKLDAETVQAVATDLNNLLKKAQKSSLKAIKKKYSTEKFGEVALMSPVMHV